MLVPIAMIPSRMGPNFCRSMDAVLGIHVFSDLIIFVSLYSTRSSAVQSAIDDIPSCSGVSVNWCVQ